MKAKLVDFSREITEECGMPEICFGEDGISKHIQDYFNEQRRYTKSGKKFLEEVSVIHCKFECRKCCQKLHNKYKLVLVFLTFIGKSIICQ